MLKMQKLNHIEPVGFGTQENPRLDAWCLHATSIKMGDPTQAVQWGGSGAQQPVKNAGGSVCDPYPLPFCTASSNTRTGTGPGAQLPFPTSPVCSCLLSALVNI